MRQIFLYYRRIRKHLIAADLAALTLFLYGERFLPTSLRDALLPAFLIGALALLFEVMLSASDQRPGKNDQYPDDVAGFGDRALALLAKGTGAREIDIIANTGGSIITSFLREVLQTHSYRLTIRIAFFDHHSDLSRLVPEHWPAKVPINIEKLEQIRKSKCTIHYSKYPWPPCIGGVMIDKKYLFLGFRSWDPATGRIADRRDHHTFYERTDQTEHLFRLFLSWSRDASMR